MLLGKGLTAILAVQILQLKASKYFCIGYEVNPEIRKKKNLLLENEVIRGPGNTFFFFFNHLRVNECPVAKH